jgi:hypothetical protein
MARVIRPIISRYGPHCAGPEGARSRRLDEAGTIEQDAVGMTKACLANVFFRTLSLAENMR